MRLVVLSDCVLPTPLSGGHGLGRMAHQVATGLLARGHDTTLFAKIGSSFGGNLVMPPDAEFYPGEHALAREAYRRHKEWPYDAVLDHGHLHVLAGLFPDLPAVNVYHDVFQTYTRCPVVLSEGQRATMPPPFDRARVIHNALDPAAFTPNYEHTEPPYALFLGALSEIKQPFLAMEACARFGVKLVVAGAEILGKMPWDGHGNVEYTGIVSGEGRDSLLRNARLFLQLGTGESFGLTTLEAGLLGTPVVAWPAGGSLDLICYGVNGVFVPTTGGDPVGNVCDAMERAWWMNRRQCREFAESVSSVENQIEQYERALEAVIEGTVW